MKDRDPSPKFRLANEADIERLASLINSAYRGESARGGWTTESHLLGGLRTDADDLREILGRSTCCFLLCLDDLGSLQGCVYLELRASQTCYLGMLSVSPLGQARGTGRALLTEAEKFARDTYHCVRMEMTVISVRHELLAWYERRGYRRTGTYLPFPAHPRFGVVKGEPLELEILQKPLQVPKQ